MQKETSIFKREKKLRIKIRVKHIDTVGVKGNTKFYYLVCLQSSVSDPHNIKVSVGDLIEAATMAGRSGDVVTLSEVLLIDEDGKTTLGTPTVKGASVEAKIDAQHRGEKSTSDDLNQKSASAGILDSAQSSPGYKLPQSMHEHLALHFRQDA